MRLWEILNFKGSPCTKDCSGHLAGYRWGEMNPGAIADGPSNSFNNGTKIAAAERKRRRAQRQQGIPRRGQQPVRGQPGFTPRTER